MKKQKPDISFEGQLQSVPIRNRRARIEKSPENPTALAIEVELKYTGLVGLLSRALKPRRTRTYELSGLSRDIFDRIDGKTTIDKLIDHLMAAYKLSFFEARALVLQYTRDLMQRGLIAITGQEEKD